MWMAFYLMDLSFIHRVEKSSKPFSVKDGLGLTAARKSGIKLAIITARISPDG